MLVSVRLSTNMVGWYNVVLVLVTFSMVTGDMVSDEVIHDMRELRREVEQLRNEVRRSREDRDSDNNKIIIDWLTESVKELQSEIREVVKKESENKHFASEKDVELVNKELKNMKEDYWNLKVEEEKHFAAIELIEFDLHHSHSHEEKVKIDGSNLLFIIKNVKKVNSSSSVDNSKK